MSADFSGSQFDIYQFGRRGENWVSVNQIGECLGYRVSNLYYSLLNRWKSSIPRGTLLKFDKETAYKLNLTDSCKCEPSRYSFILFYRLNDIGILLSQSRKKERESFSRFLADVIFPSLSSIIPNEFIPKQEVSISLYLKSRNVYPDSEARMKFGALVARVYRRIRKRDPPRIIINNREINRYFLEDLEIFSIAFDEWFRGGR